jgi:hypothetical protein
VSLRDHLLDIRPLKGIPAFRSFWIGSTVSGIGNQISGFALLYSVWQLSHSSLLVGLSGIVSRGTMLQLETPDALRGRMNSLDFLVGAGGPSLGNLRAGVVASLTSAAFSTWIGGLACMIGTAVIAVSIPSLRAWRSDVPSGRRAFGA